MNEAEIRGRAYLESKGMSGRIIDFKNTDITAESTALALDVDVDRICKGLAFFYNVAELNTLEAENCFAESFQ